MFCIFFFFKQKTAYEMRISDWSSDVCSSDLLQNVDGGIQGIATVSALFQEFTVGSVQITGGDKRYSYESECLAAGKKLDAGERCNVIVKFKESGDAGYSAAQQKDEPELRVMGNSTTPGGPITTMKTRARIIPAGADGELTHTTDGS